MPSSVFCGFAGSNITRLLNTPMTGSTTEMVPSSWIDMLAGLSRCVIRSTPPDFSPDFSPDFCAKDWGAPSNKIAIAAANSRRIISSRVLFVAARPGRRLRPQWEASQRGRSDTRTR